MSTATVY